MPGAPLLIWSNGCPVSRFSTAIAIRDVIRGHEVEATVTQRVPQRVAVGRRAQGR